MIVHVSKQFCPRLKVSYIYGLGQGLRLGLIIKIHINRHTENTKLLPTKGSGIIHCFSHESWRSGVTAHAQKVEKLINIISTLF